LEANRFELGEQFLSCFAFEDGCSFDRQGHGSQW
jgi:hypothetical protein